MHRRVSLGTSPPKGLSVTLERLAVTFAPAAVNTYRKFELAKAVIRAVIEGLCVFLLTCMVLSAV